MAERVMAILADAKRLAQEYRALTGKPLGITGEVAEFEAARILGVELTPARQAGHDAVEHVNGTTRRLQVKGRCRLEGFKAQPAPWVDKDCTRMGSRVDGDPRPAVEIYEAERPAVVAALTVPGSKARNEAGAMAVSKFKAIGRLRWRRP
jgi:hypothetical protein